jgi:hypothetical protein
MHLKCEQMTHNSITEDYVRLALAINRHLPGYAEVYYGPREWKDESNRSELGSLNHLAQLADQLLTEIAASSEFDEQRRDFLNTQLAAMHSLLAILQGSRMPVYAEAKSLYGINYQWVDEAEFREAHLVLDELLPRGGTLYDRARTMNEETRLSLDTFKRIAHLAKRDLRKRTIDRLPLPENDSVELVFVENKPWPAYNRYYGDFFSRVEINTDMPLHVGLAVYLISHELYPGHHTEFSIKEDRLYRARGREEHCLSLMNSPATTISEGIAERGLMVIMTAEEWVEWHSEVLYPAAGIAHVDAARRHLIGQAFKKTDGVYGNAVYLIHDQGKSDAEVVEYLKEFRLMADSAAKNCVRFIQTPPFRTHYLTYLYGGMLLDELFEQHADLNQCFSRLLVEPMTPSQVRAWINGEDHQVPTDL